MRRVLELIAISVLFGTCSLACGDAAAPATGTTPPGAAGSSGAAALGGSAGAVGNASGGAAMAGGGALAGGGAAACVAPQLSCAGSGCVDVTSNDQHCGGCSLACTAGKHCAAGKCECAPGQTACGDSCVDLLSDRLHCGTCELACPADGLCQGGHCTAADGCFGPAGDVTLARLVIYQTVAIPLMANQMEVVAADRKADVIAGREALLRAFVTPGAGWQPRELSARVHLSDATGPLKDVFVKATPKVSSTESDLKTTFNLLLPKELLKPGVRYSVELVECSAAQGTPASPRFPAAGDVPLGARTVGSLKVHFVPFQVGDQKIDASEQTLTHIKQYLEAIFPISELVYSLGDVYQVDAGTRDLSDILDHVFDLRSSEAPADDVYYFGISPEHDGSLGTSFVPDGPDDPDFFTAVGWSFDDEPEESSNTIAHELGHNHGLEHAPGCDVDGPDPDYPYLGADDEALLGSWGYDRRSQLLMSPLETYDLMSYCRPRWFSDYNYEKVLERVAQVNGAVPHASKKPALRRDWRVLIATSDGAARWGHPHRGRTPSRDPEPATVFDEHGIAVATVSVYRIPTTERGSSFILIPSPAPRWFSVRVSGVPPVAFE